MQGQKEVSVFFTEMGEIIASPTVNGGCQFTLLNPNASEKAETVVYINTLRMVANYLKHAQQAVQQYWAMKEEEGERAKTMSTEPCNSGTEAAEGERVVLFNRDLTQFVANGLKMKAALEASVYMGKPYIFFKRYFYLKDDPNVEDRWQACKGCFQFTVNDNSMDMMDFATENERLYSRKKASRAVEQNTAATNVGQDHLPSAKVAMQVVVPNHPMLQECSDEEDLGCPETKKARVE